MIKMPSERSKLKILLRSLLPPELLYFGTIIMSIKSGFHIEMIILYAGNELQKKVVWKTRENSFMNFMK